MDWDDDWVFVDDDEVFRLFEEGDDVLESSFGAEDESGKGSILDNSFRKARMLVWRFERRAGWVRSIWIDAEAVVASIAGREAEKTDADELILCGID